MARDFPTATGSVDCVSWLDSPSPITQNEMTIACWFNPDALPTFMTVMSIGDRSTTSARYCIFTNNANMYFQYVGGVSGNNACAYTDDGLSIGTWHHCVMSSNSSGHLKTWYDGGNEQTDSTNTVASGTPTGFDYLVIGGREGASNGNPPDYGLDGSVAWPAVWDVQLTAAEAASLAAGVHPYLIRPQNLVWFSPLSDGVGNERDLVGGLTITETGTVAKVDNPPIIQPSAQILQFPQVTSTPATFNPGWAINSNVVLQ